MILVPYVRLLRPVQWLKNLMLFFPPFLGGVFFSADIMGSGTLPLISFCLGSSAIYIFNDIMDAPSDALHSRKRNRPIPSGAVTTPAAAVLALSMLAIAVVLAVVISRPFLLLLLCYIVVAGLYSLKLKDFPIVDLFCISAGFLFRLHAGGEVFGIHISEWLFLSVFLLALFLSTGKRLCEKNLLGDAAGGHRKSLILYPDGFLQGTMYLTGSAVLVTYTMYVVQRPSLIYTIPLCTFGLLRYILRVQSGLGGDPTESLLHDLPLFLVGTSWVVMIGFGIYLGH